MGEREMGGPKKMKILPFSNVFLGAFPRYVEKIDENISFIVDSS